MLLWEQDISVIICSYTEARWEDVVAAVESVRQQTLPVTEIIMVIDHNTQLLKRVQKYISDVIVVENTETRGLSGARNSGIAVAKSELIAFLDDDAVAAPDWLASLTQYYVDNPQMLGTGGAVIPLWETAKPSWFPEEFYWVVGCTYRGMPETIAPIRNPIGANMSLRRAIFDAVGGFRCDIGRVGSQPIGCEETELCIRASQSWPKGIFLYCPSARVFHRVPKKRASWSYFCARCYSEGLSKAFVAKYVGIQEGLASERTYTFNVLPKGVLRGFTDLFRKKDISAMARSVAILVGLMMTTVGYLIGAVQKHRIGPHRVVQMSSSFQTNVTTPRSAITQSEA